MAKQTPETDAFFSTQRQEEVERLTRENGELVKQVADLQQSLRINKECMKVILEPVNGFKGVNIIHSFVKENLKLQTEVFALQNKLSSALKRDRESIGVVAMTEDHRSLKTSSLPPFQSDLEAKRTKLKQIREDRLRKKAEEEYKET